ncbi:MAG: helix-turn-helix domain-containing protein [Nitrospiraceae bacterium]
MNGNLLQAVPTIDELLNDATKAATLSPEVARTMLAGLAGLLPVLIAQSARDTGKAEAPAVEKWLTVDEVVSQFGVTVRWLYRHKRHLPHSQPTRKTILFPEERLRRWFAARKTN